MSLGWLDRMWYTHMVKYYPEIQRKKLERFTLAWTDLKNILESEKSKLQSYMYSLTSYVEKKEAGESILCIFCGVGKQLVKDPNRL